MNDSGVSIIIPAYNEKGGIGPSLDRLLGLLKESRRPVEVIVIDDGSTDGTGDVLSQYAVRVIRHPVNRGYGAALKTGIRHAKYDLIAITDADGTYPNERLMEFVDLLESTESDMVVGARTGANVQIPIVRKPAKFALRKLAEYAAGQKIPDINSGMRVFRRDLAERFLGMLPNGFSFTTTITLAALTNGFIVRYVSIDYMRREGKSKISPFQDTLNFTQLIGRMALYFAPLRVFVPTGILLMLAAAFVAAYSIFTLGKFADVTTVLLAVAALQMIGLGMVAQIVNKRSVSHQRP